MLTEKIDLCENFVMSAVLVGDCSGRMSIEVALVRGSGEERLEVEELSRLSYKEYGLLRDYVCFLQKDKTEHSYLWWGSRLGEYEMDRLEALNS
jgi:hypothetical protein